MGTYRRRLIREKVLQVLYAYEISKDPINVIMEQLLVELKSHQDDMAFARRLITSVIQNEAELERIIRERVAHWEFDRIAVIDRMLLRMGITELLYFPDIPPKVTINELIEIAKAYSTEKSGKFINGVLDAILEGLRSSETLQKVGRGLVNTTLPKEHNPPSKEPH